MLGVLGVLGGSLRFGGGGPQGVCVVRIGPCAPKPWVGGVRGGLATVLRLR